MNREQKAWAKINQTFRPLDEYVAALPLTPKLNDLLHKTAEELKEIYDQKDKPEEKKK